MTLPATQTSHLHDTVEHHDVVVVGGGIAGAAMALQLALADLKVLVLEARAQDTPVPGSWVLTPFAVSELDRLGVTLGPDAPGQLLAGVRVLSHGAVVPIEFETIGEARSITRSFLLHELSQAAIAAGASWKWSSNVDGPVLDDGIVVGVCIGPDQIMGETFVVADGALSHFGRALGTSRRRTRPQALVAVATVDGQSGTGPEDAWLDLAVDLRDRFDLPVPGLGWVVPVANNRLDVGVGVLNTFRDSDAVSITDVLQRWRAEAPGVSDATINVAIGTDIGRIPLGDGVWPRTGPNWIAIGDAVAMTSPLNGAGVAAALSTARLGTAAITNSVRNNDGLAIRKYEQALDDHLGDELRVGRLAGRALTHPRVTNVMTRAAAWSDAKLARAVQLAVANDESESRGRLQRFVSQVAKLAPEPPEHA